MKTILLIEDNRQIRDNVTEILELSHYKVFTAENGKEGVTLAISNQPDLILCDIMMPELDGYGVLHMLQKNPQLQDTPFIFLTAKTEQADLRKGMSLGADDYITKPFNPTDLLNAVENRLAKSEGLKKRFKHNIPEVTGPDIRQDVDSLVEELMSGRHIDIYKKKQRIYIEGNHPLRLYYVKKGKVKIYKTNERGKELILKIINEGEIFGYTALLLNSLYSDNADALEDAEIATLPSSEFQEFVRSNPRACVGFTKLLATEIITKDEQMIGLAFNSLRKKVANALVSLQSRYNDKAQPLSINLSRENLAALAGAATESLIRTLTDFKAEHLIDIKGGNIIVKDFDKLAKIAD